MKRNVSLSLEDNLIDEVKELAKEHNRPFSNMIETILKQYVKKNPLDK